MRITFGFRLNPNMHDIIRGTAVAFIQKILGSALGFIAGIITARLLGAEGIGLLALAGICAGIAGLFGRLGLDNAILRFVSAALATEDWERAAGAYQKGLLYAFVGSVVVSVILFALAPLIATEIFDDPKLKTLLRISALAIVPATLAHMGGQLLRALQWIGTATFIQAAATPLFFLIGLLLIIPFASLRGNVETVSWIGVVASAIVAVIGWGAWRRAAGVFRGRRGHFSTLELFKASLPLLWVAAIDLVIGWTDVLMLGFMTDSSSVGIYSSASRTATIAAFFLVSANITASPKFSALYERGDLAGLQSVAQGTARLVTLLALPVIALFVFAPSLVLSIYGDEFMLGASALAILSIGQLVNIASGSVVFLLLMTDHQKIVGRIITIAGIGNIVLNALLIPRYGFLGACIATAISMSAANLILVWAVWRNLGIVSAVWPTHHVAQTETAS